jgi:RNAse (barnase) inhibitor barstar
MNTILDILQGEVAPNIHQIRINMTETELAELAQSHNCQVFYIDGRNITNKPDFLAKIAVTMNFPDYFGKNWDALQDCITDIDCCEDFQYLIVYDHWQNFANNNPKDWQILNDIFLEAIAYWEERQVLFNVLLVMD